MKITHAAVSSLLLLLSSSFVSADATSRRLRGKAGKAGCDLFSKGGKAGKSSKSKKASKSHAFNRVSTFQACRNIEADCNTNTETVAEIVAASHDGMTLVYTDSQTEKVGFVDIRDPSNPSALGVLAVGGEPTSVSVWGDYAIVAVNTSDDYVNTSGKLLAIDIATKTIAKEWVLGGQPDSVSVSKDGQYIVVAIENERDEDLGEGIPPQVGIFIEKH